MEGVFSVDHHNPVMYSVSGACFVLPGFGISSLTSKFSGGRSHCHGKHCLVVEMNGLTISWYFTKSGV